MVVDRFFIWVAEATSEQKLRAVEALVAAYFDARIGEAERESIEAALTLVAEDADIDVRRRLAEVLAEIDETPRHLLLDLLYDHPSVAAIIAGRSEALIDAELVDLVAQSGPEVQFAVAGRRRVGPTVATALAEAGDRAAAVTLLSNPAADIPALSLERLVGRFGEFSDVRAALLARPHVPITVRHLVLEKLSEAIENLVVVKTWMQPERAGTVTRDAKDKATVALAAHAGAAETVVLVEHLRRTGQLTTRLLLRAACVGNLRFVEESLASLSGVPSARVSALVADGRESALQALYRRAAMPDRAFPAFLAAVEVHRELLGETGGLDGRPGDQARFSRRLVERVLTRFSAFERRDVDDLLVLLRAFAADAAREHVRNVMADRMADARRALAAPAAEEAPLVATDGHRADVAFDATDAAGALGAAFAPHAAVEFVDEPVAEGEYLGLFSHVRLEDLPPEWLVGEVAPEALWGDDDVPFRRTLEPELPQVSTEEVALDPAVEEILVDGVETALSDLLGNRRRTTGAPQFGLRGAA